MTDHANIDHTGLTGVGASAAADVTIADSGGYFTGTDVEAALQELGAGGGGGGGITQAYVGYNTIGGTSVAPTDYDHVVQKITLANDCLLTSIDLYIKNNSAGNSGRHNVVVYDDVSGKPVHLLAAPSAADYGANYNLYRVSGTPGDARWFTTPVGIWLPAGDYWIGFHWLAQGAQHLVYYDATGTGYKWGAGGNAFDTDAPDTSGTVYLLTAQTRTYSIRANTIR